MLKNRLCQLILNYIKASFVNIEKSISWEKVSKGEVYYNNYWDHEPEFFWYKKNVRKSQKFLNHFWTFSIGWPLSKTVNFESFLNIFNRVTPIENSDYWVVFLIKYWWCYRRSVNEVGPPTHTPWWGGGYTPYFRLRFFNNLKWTCKWTPTAPPHTHHAGLAGGDQLHLLNSGKTGLNFLEFIHVI